jgi:hypothetical protein
VYEVESDDNAGYQVAALPEHALSAYASLIDLIALHPWSGEPLRNTDSTSPMRTHTFGHDDAGLAIYLILEDQQRVVVLRVLWAG